MVCKGAGQLVGNVLIGGVSGRTATERQSFRTHLKGLPWTVSDHPHLNFGRASYGQPMLNGRYKLIAADPITLV